MSFPVVSIIIPAYNAGKLMDKCLTSLENQTYKNLEIIFIDDCSTDLTYDLLIGFKHKLRILQPNSIIHIIRNTNNLGVANSRNLGLGKASGDYIYYLDADDYLPNNSIELLVNEALLSDADIVGGNWVLQFVENGRLMKQPSPVDSKQAIEFMSKGIMRWNLWLFLVKRELYLKFNIRFLPGQNMGEDMLVMFKLLLHAKSIAMLNEVIYYYSQANTESLTKVYSQKHKSEVTNNLDELICYFKSYKNKNYYEELFNYLKLNIKLPLLISNSRISYDEWRNWFSESNTYCMSNDLISYRIRILQFMASKKLYWFVRLHYIIVVGFIYRFIYK